MRTETAQETSRQLKAKRVNEIQQRLLDAAEAIYAESGSAGLTARAVSARAGMTTQAIYRYFENFDDLLTAMYQRAVEGVESILSFVPTSADAAPTNVEVNEILITTARAYRQYCLAYPGRFRILRTAATDTPIAEIGLELRERLFTVLASVGARTSKEADTLFLGRLRASLAAVHGFIQAEIEGFMIAAYEPDRLFDELVHRFLIETSELPHVPYPS